MPRTTSKKAQYQARADEAMKAQLAQRKALVGAIGAAEEKYEQQLKTVVEAQKKLDELAAEVLTAYNNALKGGWTEAELKQLNITRPDTKPSKSAKNAATKPADPDQLPTPQSSNGSSTEHHGQAAPAAPAPERSIDPEPALPTGGTQS